MTNELSAGLGIRQPAGLPNPLINLSIAGPLTDLGWNAAGTYQSLVKKVGSFQLNKGLVFTTADGEIITTPTLQSNRVNIGIVCVDETKHSAALTANDLVSSSVFITFGSNTPNTTSAQSFANFLLVGTAAFITPTPTYGVQTVNTDMFGNAIASGDVISIYIAAFLQHPNTDKAISVSTFIVVLGALS